MANPQILTSFHGKECGLDHAKSLVVAGPRVFTDVGIGAPKSLGRLAFANVVPSSPVTAISAETLFDQNHIIPKNSLIAGELIKIRFQGIATATNSTDTLTIKAYIGGLLGTALISMAAQDVANNDVFQGEFELLMRTIGASGTMVGMGTYKSIPAAAGTMTIKDAILASTAIDTTADQQVGVSATWSTTNAGNSCRLDILRVERW